MREVVGNLWDYPANVRVITTNGSVKRNGEAVMGRGCAEQAKHKYPTLARDLGRFISRNGNIVMNYGMHGGYRLITFPVKHEWHQKADLNLIRRSCGQLTTLLDLLPEETLHVVMPRPGCGNGRLEWPAVRAVIAPLLDDHFHVTFHVISYKE